MAALALGAAGAVVGGTFGGPTGAQIGWALGSALGSSMDQPKSEGPRLNDLRVTGAEYGATIPWCGGSPRIAGQIIWASEKRETANRQGGGKGGGPEVTTYTYDCDLMILLTENVINGVSRIWLNGELVYGNGATKAGIWGGITVYDGSPTQLPDPTYTAAVGAANAPAYRGRGYVVITGLQLGSSGSIPNLSFEVGTALSRDYSVVKFLFKGENGLIDESVYSKLITLRNGATYVGNTIVLGGASGAGGPFVTAPAWTSEYNSHTGDFCLEAEFDLDPWVANRTYEIVAFSGLYLGFSTVGRTNPEVSLLFSDSSAAGASSISFTNAEFTDLFAGRKTIILQRVGASAKIWVTPVLGQTELLRSSTGTNPVRVNTGTPSDTFGTNQSRISIGWNDTSATITGPTSVAGVTVNNVRMSYRQMYSHTEPVPERPLRAYYEDPSVTGVAIPMAITAAVSALLDRAGYAESDYFLGFNELIEKQVRGVALGQVAPTRAALEAFQSAWFFEASKSDKIYIRPRSATSIVTIPFDELGASSDPGGEEEPLTLELGNELEIPAQIALSYPNTTQDYQASTELSDRLLSSQESTNAVQLGIGMTPAEAKGVADALVFDQLAALTKTSISVPLKYAFVEPGDIITAVNFDGRSYRLRVMTKTDNSASLRLECVLDDVGALESASVTDDDYITIDTPVEVSETEFEALGIPLLRDADDSPGYYVAAAPIIVDPANYEWKGAIVARAWNTTDYVELFRTPTPSVMGMVSNTLGNWTGGNIYDESNTLTVVTTGGQLSSHTREDMQLDQTLNVAAVGSAADGWEVLRFRTATLIGVNTYRLSGLHRGFRGTEWAISGHAASEQFILLDSGVTPVRAQTNQIGLEQNLKAVTFGLRISDVAAETFTDTGVILKPFSPANFVALASGGDFVLTWQRRSRVSYNYGGATPSVPLGESTEQYTVKIYDGATLVREAIVTTPTYTYTAANVTADGFSPLDTITFTVAQISEIVGAGYPATKTGTAQ